MAQNKYGKLLKDIKKKDSNKVQINLDRDLSKEPEDGAKNSSREQQADKIKIKLETQKLLLRERTEFLYFRRQWSKYLLLIFVFIVIFNAIFLVVIGLGWLKFADEWLVRIIFGGSFVEALGLAKIVVDFLFKEPPKK